MQSTAEWLIEETKAADFGDKRLNQRYRVVLNSLLSSPSKSLPGACKSWKETLGAYRFLNHPAVTCEDILSPHYAGTLERIKQEQVVLIAQDTTEINFTGSKPKVGMGYLRSENSHGFYLHPSLALTPERVCLGVIDLQSWSRERLGVVSSRKNKPIEEKESFRWLKGYEAANSIALATPDTLIVSVADREGDIYELLEKMPSASNKAYWLIRSSTNRGILTESGKAHGLRLWETVAATKPVGILEFKLPAGTLYSRGIKRARPLRKERMVQQEIKVCTVSLRPPQRKEKRRSSVAITVVHCKEINPPTAEEKIEWFLLTSRPVKSAESAIDIVKWYLCRWQIELFFKILKSGCTIEELQFHTLKATLNCVAFYSIVAWRILYLTMLGRHCPDMACSAVFEESEWQSVYTIVNGSSPPINNPPKLSDMILMIAQLGGFLGRKGDGCPGSKVMWIGMQRMKDFALAWQIFHSVTRKNCV